MSIPQFIVSFEFIEKGQVLREQKVSIAGRVLSFRRISSDLVFYDVQADGSSVQAIANTM